MLEHQRCESRLTLLCDITTGQSALVLGDECEFVIINLRIRVYPWALRKI